jgi:hypothetical protein
MRWWEPFAVFWLTFLVFLLFVPRMNDYLTPKTGDEPFYLMTAISLLKDGDLNECNNYRQRDEAQLYPSFMVEDLTVPRGFKGFAGAPYPLPPHPAQLVPANRMCTRGAVGVEPEPGGAHDELYSKHGLGLTLLILPAFALGGVPWVTYFLVVLGALLATNIYLLAREATGLMWPAFLTWAAFAFTVPLMPYSYLIFPELPAALLVVYAFRRIRLWDNNPLQTVGIALCIAFLPWLHYRFVPVCAALFAYYLYQVWRRPARTLDDANTALSTQPELGAAQEPALPKRRWGNLVVVTSVIAGSAALLMAFFYHRYAQVLPSARDHAGSSDLAGTARGIVGLLLDEQWGLLISAPIFLLVFVGVALMLRERRWRMDLLWVGLVFVPYYLVIANYVHWWGEWCPPARYLASTLPVLALPFSVGLAQARSAVSYKVLYGVLMLVSVGMMAGYLSQPQWMYNHPSFQSTNQVITSGLPQLIYNTPLQTEAFQIGRVIADNIPSFVLPAAYYVGGQDEYGDMFSHLAWRTSITPGAIGLAIVALGLALAWPATRRRKEVRTTEGQLETPPLEAV